MFEHAESQASAVEQGTRSMVLVQKSIEEVSENNGILGLATRSVENAVQRARAMAQVVEGINPSSRAAPALFALFLWSLPGSFWSHPEKFLRHDFPQC